MVGPRQDVGQRGPDVAGLDAAAPDAGPLDVAALDTSADADDGASEAADVDDSDVPVALPDTAAVDAEGPLDVPLPKDSLLPVCGDETVTVAKVLPATVLVVLDRSGSMSGQKWTDAQAAINTIAEAYEGTLRFGLLMYPKADDLCVVANSPDVPFALQNANKLATAMAGASLMNGTPTGGALVAAAQLLSFVDPASQRVVVLATDGQPTCPSSCSSCQASGDGLCLNGSCSLCAKKKDCIRKELEDTVGGLLASGVKTYVIGLPGSDKGADNLNAIAEAGGTAQPGDPKYYAVSDAQTMGEALAAITGAVSSCNAKVEPTPGYAFVSVAIDGTKIAKDPTHQDGWDLLEGDVLQFYGSACESASKPTADVSVTWICKK